MARVLADELEVCEDCALMIANGELGFGNELADQHHAAKMVAQWGDDTPGLVLTCDHNEDGSCPEFVRSPCDGCGSTLAGSRHLAAVLGND